MLSNINPKDNSNLLVSKNSKNAMKKIELIKKGEVGYIEGMDKDGDGIVTMDEFNEYCRGLVKHYEVFPYHSITLERSWIPPRLIW